MPHIAAFVTPHGYGHATVMTAVLNALRMRRQDLSITLISQVPEPVFQARLRGGFRYIHHAGATDFGMRMTSSVGVRVTDSLDAYAQAHADWSAVVDDEARLLSHLRPDLVLSCAGYACLAAATRLGLPAVGLGPFSWEGVLRAYAGDSVRAAPVLDRMREAYEEASLFLETAPAVPTGLANARAVGPVGAPAEIDRAMVRQRLGMAPGDDLGLLSMGGIPDGDHVPDWPWDGSIRWLSAGPIGQGTDFTEVAALGLTVSEAIAACDVVVTKPGYGTFVEAACAGAVIAYRERPDWPETDGLDAWARAYVPTLRIDDGTFLSGGFLPQLQRLVQVPRTPLDGPWGNEQAADILSEYL